MTAERSRVQGLSDQIFISKEDRQITHNSMFADYHHCEFRREIPSRRSFTRRRTDFAQNKTHNQIVKDPPFRFGTRQNPTLVNNLTKIGSTLSPEERRLHAWGRSAYRGTHNIRKLPDSSIKICGIFASIGERWLRRGCGFVDLVEPSCLLAARSCPLPCPYIGR
jgi:hypothetical protein